MSELRGDFLALDRPSVAILEVPALSCASCGASRFTARVLDRLATIVEGALRHAETRGLVEVNWIFTPHGPPEVGGMPRDFRNCFAALRALIAEERMKVEAAERLGDAKPNWFH